MTRRRGKPKPTPKPGWRRLKRVGGQPIRCPTCSYEHERDDTVYWVPCVIRGVRITGHPGWCYCAEPRPCGKAIERKIEGTAPARPVRDPSGTGAA